MVWVAHAVVGGQNEASLTKSYRVLLIFCMVKLGLACVVEYHLTSGFVLSFGFWGVFSKNLTATVVLFCDYMNQGDGFKHVLAMMRVRGKIKHWKSRFPSDPISTLLGVPTVRYDRTSDTHNGQRKSSLWPFLLEPRVEGIDWLEVSHPTLHISMKLNIWQKL